MSPYVNWCSPQDETLPFQSNIKGLSTNQPALCPVLRRGKTPKHLATDGCLFFLEEILVWLIIPGHVLWGGH